MARLVRVRGVVVLLATSLTTFTGCSSESLATVPAPTAVEREDADPSIAAGKPLPLDSFTVRIWGIPSDESQSEQQIRLESEHRWRENFVANCMAQLGFTYIPNTNSTLEPAFWDGPQFRSIEYAEQWGFGLSNGVILQSNSSGAGTIDSPENIALTEAMSPAERDAWFSALQGNWVEINVHGLDLEPNPGCRGEADDILRGSASDDFTLISDLVSGFQTQVVQNSAEFLRLNSDWANCMATAGYPEFNSPGALIQTLITEWETIRSANNVTTTWDWNSFPQGPPGLLLSDDGATPTTAQPSDDPVSTFAAREIELAIADANCLTQIAWTTRLREITFQLQTEFVANHQDELEAWADSAESRREAAFGQFLPSP